MHTPTLHACGPGTLRSQLFPFLFFRHLFLVTDLSFFVIVFGNLLVTHLEQVISEVFVRVRLDFFPLLVFPRLPVLPGN